MKVSSLRMKLERFTHAPDLTGGVLTGGEFVVVTRENPWGYNQAMQSCIPLGVYRVLRTVASKRDDQWIIVGIQGRLPVELDFTGLVRDPVGDILVCPFPSISRQVLTADEDRCSMSEFDTLTLHLNSFTLEITQRLPYTAYVEQFGYARPPTEEIL